MEIVFSWEDAGGRVSPACNSSIINSDGVSPLACLLTDDGGQIYTSTISWIDEGLKGVRAVKDRKIFLFEWCRDAWAAAIGSSEVKIYSLHDDSCFEMMKLDEFEKILSEWRDFFKLSPDISIRVKINV